MKILMQVGGITAMAIIVAACKPQMPAASSLAALDYNETGFIDEACSGSHDIARISSIRMGARTLTFIQSSYCDTGSNQAAMNLNGANNRKPVFIHYGYYGNAPEDQLIDWGRQDALAWAKQDFRVLDVSQLPIAEAQAKILADRRANPMDYGRNSHVVIDIDAHGGVAEDGNHRIYSGQVQTDKQGFVNSHTTSSMRTTDVQSALIEGVGHKTGNITCIVQSCYSGAVAQEPAFKKMETSKINPQQNRVFLFGSSADSVSIAPTQFNDHGYMSAEASIEQATMTLMQSAKKEGLKVGEFKNTLKKKNLIVPDLEISTVYYPSSLGASTDAPPGFGGIGGASHDVSTLWSEGPQGPVVVGNDNALILPPGINPDKRFSPVKSKKQMADAYDKWKAPAGVIKQGGIQTPIKAKDLDRPAAKMEDD